MVPTVRPLGGCLAQTGGPCTVVSALEKGSSAPPPGRVSAAGRASDCPVSSRKWPVHSAFSSPEQASEGGGREEGLLQPLLGNPLPTPSAAGPSLPLPHGGARPPRALPCPAGQLCPSST